LGEAGTWLEKPNSSVLDVGRLLLSRANVRALDLGAGVGRNSIPFVKLFDTSKVMCDCVEILPEAVEILRTNAASAGVANQINPICSNAADYQIASGVYDMIMAMSVLEHAYTVATIDDGMQRIQEGTNANGFNCLSIATDLRETDGETGQPLEPLIQANLSEAACRTLLSTRYAHWDIQRLDFSNFKDAFMRDGKRIEWTATYCLFVAQKVK
jgi:cyclopropane fatty-acyl-phospholipid synthase-like methyltransferase